MSVWNIFDSDAFSLHSMTAAINHLPYRPQVIAGLGIFEEEGIATTTALIEEYKGTLSLVPVVPRNGPGLPVSDERRKVIPFAVPHLPQRATIMADEVQGVREFGSESQAKTVESVRDARLAKMRAQLDYTIEAHRLAAIKGNFVDVNGAEISLYTTFDVGSQQTVDFALNVGTTKVRQKCMDVIAHIEDGLRGDAFTEVVALCGRDFWADLIEHPALKDTVQGWQAAQSLRADPRLEIEFGGIRFIRYRGTSLVSIANKEAFAFARGVPNLFITRFAPANYVETVNTIGLPYYSKSEPLPMNKGIALEAQSNPLNICTRPRAVVKLTTP